MENDIQPLVIYKNKQQITNTQICTDMFCTIASALFAVTMLILAAINFNLDKLIQTTYPSDIDGRLCTRDNSNYNYLYFTSPSDTTKRLCVANCPSGKETALDCLPSDGLSCKANRNSNFQVMIYPTVQSDTSMGLFCMPVDQKIKQAVLHNSKLKQKYLFVSAYRSILYSALCAVGLGFFFLLLTSFLPGIMTYVSIILGGLGCIGIGIMLFVVNSELLHVYNTLRIVFCVFIILIGLMCLISLIWNSKDLTICINYLSYAGKFFGKALVLVAFIFVFYLLLAGLLTLMIFQILAFWSHGQVKFYPQQVHKSLGDSFSTVMLIICGIEFFWGLAFLKESFNFLISGTTVYFYFKNQLSIPFALGNLFKFHWGSVVAGSFLLDFFYIFDVFYDFMKPKNEESQNTFTKICCCCDRVLGLARSDTFSFLNLVGQPYCNSARYCQQIDDRSDTFEGSQSVFRFFRIGAHVMLASISTILTYIFMVTSQSEVSVLGLIFSYVVNLFVVTFFVSLMAQIAEAVSLCHLVENYLKNQHQLPSRYSKAKISQGPVKYNKKKESELYDNGFGGYTIHETHV